MRKLGKACLVLAALCAIAGCGVLKPAPKEDEGLAQAMTKPLPPETAMQVLNEAGKNWWYGQGVGETALNVGGVLLFPPYALYLLGNAGLSLSGYQTLHVTDALPDEERKAWNEVYDGLTSGPGRLNAAVSGEDFRTREEAKAKISKLIKEASQSNSQTAGGQTTGGSTIQRK